MTLKNYFYHLSVLAVCLLGMTGCNLTHNGSGEKSAGPSLPNILIIYADDMGYGDMACQNPGSKIPTPNLDRLASEGVRFTDGHSSSGICTPSRYALLTGRYHWRKFHGIVGSFGPSKFDAQRLTLPEMLQEKGYHTGCIGKWHLGWDWDAVKKPGVKKVDNKVGYAADAFDWSKPIPDGPVAHGFDSYFGDGTINFPPYCWVENDRIVEAPTEVLKTGREKTAEGSWEMRAGPKVKDWDPYEVLPTLTKRGVAWIANQKKDKPFFLYFALPSPHAPIIPNKEFQGKTKAGGYGDFMFQTDWVAGQLLNALKDNGFDKDTLVIFTSDNGPERYAYDRIKNHNHYSMGELRGLKRDIFEGGHRVPFVVRWPGVIKPNRVSHALVSQIDLMATIAAITDYSLPQGAAEDSLDLSPLWRDNSDQTQIRTSHVHNTYANKYAIRKDNWVLIDHKTGNTSAVPDWVNKAEQYDTHMPNGGLFNLQEEIGQRKNLISQHPEKAAELRKLLKEIRQNK